MAHPLTVKTEIALAIPFQGRLKMVTDQEIGDPMKEAYLHIRIANLEARSVYEMTTIPKGLEIREDLKSTMKIPRKTIIVLVYPTKISIDHSVALPSCDTMTETDIPRSARVPAAGLHTGRVTVPTIMVVAGSHGQILAALGIPTSGTAGRFMNSTTFEM